jgi:hypothetical protein
LAAFFAATARGAFVRLRPVLACRRGGRGLDGLTVPLAGGRGLGDGAALGGLLGRRRGGLDGLRLDWAVVATTRRLRGQ